MLSPGARGVLETKYLPLTPSVSRQRDKEGFQGLKRKALSCLDCCPFLRRKVVYRSLWLFRSSLPVVKDCVHVVLWLSKTGYWRPDSVVRHPALLSLTVLSALFPHKIVGIKHMSLHTIILVSKVLSLAWGLVPRGLPCSVHLKLIWRPLMVSARSYGKSRGLCVTVKSLYFSLSSFPRPFGSSLGCTELS